MSNAVSEENVKAAENFKEEANELFKSKKLKINYFNITCILKHDKNI